MSYEEERPSLVLFRADVPAHLARERVTPETLPSQWRETPAPAPLREIGNAWVARGRTALLFVPSAVVPQEANALLSPEHPDFAHIALAGPFPFAPDARAKFMRDSPQRCISVRAIPATDACVSRSRTRAPAFRPAPSSRFEPYARAPGITQPGLGLGLATVKRIICAYGGTVGVRRAKAGGAIFWFDLPHANAVPREEKAGAAGRAAAAEDEHPARCIPFTERVRARLANLVPSPRCQARRGSFARAAAGPRACAIAAT